ncbi:hypothetical protein D3C87_1207070 [compost metagenome]
MLENEAVTLAVLADITDAVFVDGFGNGADAGRAIFDPDFALRDGEFTHDRFCQFGAPSAHQPVKADDFTLAHGKTDIAMADCGRNTFEFKHQRIVLDRAFAPATAAFGTANHQAHQVLASETFHRPAFAGVFAIPQHRHPVANVENLLQLVADEDQACAIIAQAAQNAEEVVRFARGQRCRGFVEQKNPALQGKRLRNFHELHLRDGKLGYRHRRIDFQIESLQPAACVAVQRGVVDGFEIVRPKLFHVDILGNREARDEVAFLMDDTDAAGNGFARVAEAHFLPIDKDLAAALMVDAGNDLDQRRFAGAVLTQQRVDRSRLQRKIDALERPNAGKHFFDVTRLKNRLLVHDVRPFLSFCRDAFRAGG